MIMLKSHIIKQYTYVTCDLKTILRLPGTQSMPNDTLNSSVNFMHVVKHFLNDFPS